MKSLFLVLIFSVSFGALARDPFWSCTENEVRYEIDWNEVELNLKDIAHIKINKKRVQGKVVGMSDWDPDVVFFDYTRNKTVILLLDAPARNDNYKMYEYENSQMGELLSDKINCRFNY